MTTPPPHPVDAWCASNSHICTPYERSPLVGGCTSSSHCPAKHYCYLFSCYAGNDGDPCLTTSDCTMGGHSRYCYGQTCYLGVESDPCIVGSSDCAPGLTCRVGYCRR